MDSELQKLYFGQTESDPVIEEREVNPEQYRDHIDSEDSDDKDDDSSVGDPQDQSSNNEDDYEHAEINAIVDIFSLHMTTLNMLAVGEYGSEE